MDLFPPRTKLARFGLFEADLEQRILTKSGLRVKLQDQPFQVLALLLERPGEIITREEIRQKLWSSDTFVEFDDGLNTAIKKLRTSLGDTADNPRFIETIPRRGYRFLAPVTFPAAAAPLSQIVPPGNVPSEIVIASREQSRVVIEKTTAKSSNAWKIAVLALVLVAGLSGYLYREHQIRLRSQAARAPEPAVQIRPSVAVIGFRNLSGRPESAWLSTAMAEMLSTELSAGRRLRLVAGENIARTKRELPLAEADTLAADTLQRLHKNLDADYVVLGSYTDLSKSGEGRIRLDIRLQDARTGEIITEQAVKGQEDELFELISEAGARLRERLGAGNLSDVQVATVRASLPANPKAARLYAEGLAKLRAYEHLAARDLLQEAVKIEPSHALAHSALAISWKYLGYDANTVAEAKKAWELSPGLERENQLWIEGFYREASTDWDRAIEIYRTLVEFFPDDVEYGLRLAEAQSNAGKAQDALATIQHLKQLPGPISDDPRIDLQEAHASTQLGQYQRIQTASNDAARKAEERGARLLLAQAKLFQSVAARNLRDLDGAKMLDEDAQRIYESVGDRYGAARARLRMSDVLWRQGQIAQSDEIADDCLKVFRELGNKKEIALALDAIGGGLIELGQLDKAQHYYDEALAVQREIGNQRGVAQELNNIGVIQYQRGELAAALKTDEETRDAYREIGDKDGLASALNNIAQIYEMQGDLPKARDHYSQSLAIRRELGVETDVAESLNNLAEVSGMQGDVEAAKKNYDDALVIRLRRGEEGAIAESRLGKAEVLLASGDLPGAESLARQASEQFKKTGEAAEEGSARATLAEALFLQQRLPEANVQSKQAADSVKKDTDRTIRLKIETIAAEVSSGSNPLDSIRRLQSVVRESEKSGLFVRRLEASLILAEVELKTGHTANGQAQAKAVQKEAEQKGFLLIARKAAAAQG
jgi:eukaryotic-like serine/threonine-protein kinase